MAKFYKLVSGVYVNIDTIVSMYYDKEDDTTYIFSADSPDQFIKEKGDITSQILSSNNDLTMHDRHVANHMYDKFKLQLSTILERLDKLSKSVSGLEKSIK